MSTVAITETPAPVENLDMMSQLLDELDMTGLETPETVEGIEMVETAGDIIEVTGEIDESESQHLSGELMKFEAYEAQVPTDDAVNLEALDTPVATAKPVKAPKVAKAPKAPKAPVEARITDIASLDASAFVLELEEPADLEANKAAIIASRPRQVKIAEKFDKALLCAAAGRRPSTFIIDCYEVLKAKKSVLASDLVSVLTSVHEYTEGTARSQVGQIMAVFPLLKIAERKGQILELNENSTLAMLYDSYIA